MQWVHEHISAFGGDPGKVIMYVSILCRPHVPVAEMQCSWGESAGSESSGYHLLMNNGSTRGLFRGVVMVRILALITYS